jgi:hypothetical protein
MRKLSKPVVIITIAVIAAALFISIGIGMFMDRSKKMRMSQLDINKKPVARKNAGVAGPKEKDPYFIDEKKKDESTIGDAIKKEQQMLKASERGGYVGGVGPSKKRKEDVDLAGMIVPEEDPLSFAKRNRVKPNIYNDGTDPQIGRLPDGDNEQARRKTWEYMYLRRMSGGFVGGNTSSMAANTAANAASNEKEAPGTQKVPAYTGQGPKVQYYRPYRAVIDRTFTSADTKAIFVATGSEIPLKGWKIVGRATSNFTDNRFHIEISGVLSLDNAHYPMKGYVASIDQSDGIISTIRHDDIAGNMASSILSGMSSFLNTLRKDTTTVEVTSGTTVTGQTKDDNRLREAGLASGDTMFQGMSKKAENSAKKTPTLIMEKDVPVLVYFMP